MGEMADYYVYDAGWVEWLDGEDLREDDHSYGITCKYCGCDHLHWQRTEHGWRLFHSESSIHKCDAYRAKEVAK